MASINYDDVFEQFLGEVTDHNLMSLCDSDAYELMVGWLHKALAAPIVRKAYSLLAHDDAIQEIEYEMKNIDSDEADELYTTEILSKQMAYIWAKGQLMSDVNSRQFFGGKEQKYFSQSAHITALQTMSKEAEADVRRMVGDRGISVNSYLGGS